MVFQFLIGTLKTLSSGKAELGGLLEFQFLIGTLKTDIDEFKVPPKGMFQFLIGTLKT